MIKSKLIKFISKNFGKKIKPRMNVEEPFSYVEFQEDTKSYFAIKESDLI